MYSASRTGDTALILLDQRPGRKHAAEVAETTRKQGERIVSLTKNGDKWSWVAVYTLPSPDLIAVEILERPHYRNMTPDDLGYSAGELMAEAVKAARA